MRTHGLGLGRLAKGVSLLVLSVGIALLPSPAFGSCVTARRTCREDADREFQEGRVGVFWYSLLLDGCDLSYFFCSSSKEKENGK